MERKEENKKISTGTEKKLSKMRESVLDKEKCKEIAKKLTQYIADNK